MVTCPDCGMMLPAHALFCARCGARVRAGAARVAAAPAPVWVQVLLWLGAGGLFWIAVTYAAFAAGLIPQASLGGAADTGSLRGTAALIAACAVSLAAAHAVAGLGLMANRPWSRTFATLVCVVWALSCVGLPLGLFAINAMWRSRSAGGPVGPAPSRTSR